MLDNVRVKDLYIAIDDYPNVSLDAPIGHAIQIMHHVLGDKTSTAISWCWTMMIISRVIYLCEI